MPGGWMPLVIALVVQRGIELLERGILHRDAGTKPLLQLGENFGVG